MALVLSGPAISGWKAGGADGRLGVLDYFPFPSRLVIVLMTFFIYSRAMPPLLLLLELRKINFMMISNVHFQKFHQERCVGDGGL